MIVIMSLLFLGAIPVNAEKNGAIYGSNGQISFTGEYQEDNGPDSQLPGPTPEIVSPGGNTLLPQTGEANSSFMYFAGATLIITMSSVLFLRNNDMKGRKKHENNLV